MPTTSIIDDYLSTLNDVLTDLPRDPLQRIIDVLKQARMEGRIVFICGNGGSAATASHMVCDLGKNTRRDDLPDMRVVGLNDNIPIFSALANDEGYESVFAAPLQSMARPGDVIVAISGSGNSPNVLRGVEVARRIGLTTIGLAGFSGGKLKDLVDVCVVVPSDSLGRIEDAHLVITHILTCALHE